MIDLLHHLALKFTLAIEWMYAAYVESKSLIRYERPSYITSVWRLFSFLDLSYANIFYM